MQKITITSLSLFLFLFTTPSYSDRCKHGQSHNSASAAIHNLYFIFSSLISAPEEVNKVNSQAELNNFQQKIDSNKRLISTRIVNEYGDCLSKVNDQSFIHTIAHKELDEKYGKTSSESKKKNSDLIEWLESDSKITPVYGISSAQALVDMAFAKVEEAKDLIPEAEARIKLVAEKRQQELNKIRSENEIAQQKLVKDNEEIAELEEAIRKQNLIKSQQEINKKKRKQLDNEKNISTPKYNYSTTGKNTQSRGDGYLKVDGVFCFSKISFDRQIEYLSRNQMEYASGCYSSPTRQNVWLKETKWNGECIIERVSDERNIWTFCEDYQSW